MLTWEIYESSKTAILKNTSEQLLLQNLWLIYVRSSPPEVFLNLLKYLFKFIDLFQSTFS